MAGGERKLGQELLLAQLVKRGIIALEDPSMAITKYGAPPSQTSKTASGSPGTKPTPKTEPKKETKK